jgi:hypothetical protein
MLNEYRTIRAEAIGSERNHFGVFAVWELPRPKISVSGTDSMSSVQRKVTGGLCHATVKRSTRNPFRFGWPKTADRCLFDARSSLQNIRVNPQSLKLIELSAVPLVVAATRAHRPHNGWLGVQDLVNRPRKHRMSGCSPSVRDRVGGAVRYSPIFNVLINEEKSRLRGDLQAAQVVASRTTRCAKAKEVRKLRARAVCNCMHLGQRRSTRPDRTN